MWWIVRLACLGLALGSARWWWPALRALPRAVLAHHWRAAALTLAALPVLALLLAQAVPLGWDHRNPTPIAEPPWDSAATRGLAVRACFDCHSNQVTWPWYSNVAPLSWLIADHVRAGRDTLNLSAWVAGDRSEGAREAAHTVENGSMPPFYYTLLHPEARLSAAERAALAAGLTATLGGR